jgi:hypothetical protein
MLLKCKVMARGRSSNNAKKNRGARDGEPIRWVIFLTGVGVTQLNFEL